ncbi:hypothetical protein SLEP1_g34617 [Rubroshorea leprosula]|uniref:Uncharacterized protein n=1 Tax=Rubroshorea leprosula TaxID=152421 RepID=A0AAV5KKJ1_9ROSI|nr:hypothetical protein SLEP1_g34617 [Rubroshorea leprosula]
MLPQPSIFHIFGWFPTSTHVGRFDTRFQNLFTSSKQQRFFSKLVPVNRMYFPSL